MEEYNYYESSYQNKRNNKLIKALAGLSVLMLVAIVALFILHFQNKNTEKTSELKPRAISGNLKIAFINSDSLWSKYLFVDDKMTELSALENQYQNQYNSLRERFEKEYRDYIEKGSAGQLSLSQQKETEERLGQQQQHIMQLDEELSAKFVEQKTLMNQMLLDTIINYIHRYNSHAGYDFIFEYSKVSGLFYATDSLDITENVVNGLNFEYRKWR